MPLFKKGKAATKPEEYQASDQGVTDIPVEAPLPSQDDVLRKVLENQEKLLANQKVIVENQQVIVDGIGATQSLMVKLSEGEGEEEEPTEEEILEAAKMLKEKKKGGKR